MKRVYLFISIFMLVTLACNATLTVTPPTSQAPLPTNTMIPPTAAPTQILASATSIPPTVTPTQIQPTAVPSAMPTQPRPPSSDGTTVSYGSVSLVLPSGLANEISGSQVPRADSNDGAWWALTPGHTQINLDGYLLQGKFHKPQIFIYPALDYAQMVPAAFEAIHRLDNILANPGAGISSNQLPPVPFFNAQQVFASNIQIVTFQSGRGVRFLAEYGQYPASANNHDLFYQFQGLTSDGNYYIVAILPINSSLLGESSDPASAIPVGGVAYPNMGSATTADWNNYYNAVTVQLNAQGPSDFVPTLNQLDLMIQSMKITQ
ncbi:MAG: hypothetical protein M1282_01530 [Chloroflexi bacterium]|nr:hypothetical protein [Chloroflexota bacterium]